MAAAAPLDGKHIAAMQGTAGFEYGADAALDRDALTGDRPLLAAGNGGSFGRWKLRVEVAGAGAGAALGGWTLQLCSYAPPTPQ